MPTNSNEPGLQGDRTRHPVRTHFKVPLTPEELGLHTWVTRAAKVRLADYLRAALDEKARATVKELIARGKKLPAWVGKMLDRP